MSWIIIVREIFSTVGDICLFIIAAYTFRLTVFPKKLRFIGFRPSFSAFEGDALTIVLENRALSPVVIQAVQVICNEYYIEIFDSNKDGECIVDGFKTATIEMAPFSKIVINEDEFSFHRARDIALRIVTPRGVQYVPFAHGPQKRLSLFIRKIKDIREKDYMFKQGLVVRNYFNEKIIKEDFRYALVYKDKAGKEYTTFISKNGMMSDAPFGYNALPENLMVDMEILQTHFEGEFSKCGLPFGLIDLWDRNPFWGVA